MQLEEEYNSLLLETFAALLFQPETFGEIYVNICKYKMLCKCLWEYTFKY